MSVRISRLRDKIAKNISDELVFDKKQKKFVRIDKKIAMYLTRDNDGMTPDKDMQKGKELNEHEEAGQ